MARTIVPLVLALGLAFLASSGTVEAAAIRFGTAVKSNVHHSLLQVAAEEKGFWKQEGLQVVWVPFEAGAAMLQAAAGGYIDMGTSAPAEVIIAIGRGMPLVIVADLKAPQNWYFWVPTKSPIQSYRDLKGARIGMVRLGGTGYAYALAALKAKGLEKEARLVAGGGTRQLMAALKLGALDATVHTAATAAALKYRGEIRPILNLMEGMPQPWVHNVVYTQVKFAQKEPESTKKVIRALVKAGQFVMANPDWAVGSMNLIAGYPLEVARAYFPEVVYGNDPRVDARGLKNVLDFLVEYDFMAKEKVPPLDKLYDTSYVD